MNVAGRATIDRRISSDASRIIGIVIGDEFPIDFAAPRPMVPRMRNASERGRLRNAIVRAGWRGTVLSMIFTLMLLSCVLAFGGLFAISSGAWIRSAQSFAIAILAGASVAWLATHRDELIET